MLLCGNEPRLCFEIYKLKEERHSSIVQIWVWSKTELATRNMFHVGRVHIWNMNVLCLGFLLQKVRYFSRCPKYISLRHSGSQSIKLNSTSLYLSSIPERETASAIPLFLFKGRQPSAERKNYAGLIISLFLSWRTNPATLRTLMGAKSNSSKSAK